MSHIIAQYHLFLSYNTQDHAFVTALAEKLKALNIQVFLDRWHLIPGQPWPERLRDVLASCKAVAVCVGPRDMGPWQQREMYFALERQNREPGFPVIPLLLPDANPPLDFLSQNMWVDFRSGLDNPMALAILQAATHGETLDPAQAERIQEIIRDICPYRGLQYFREQDAGFFFGREQAVNDLLNKLKSHNLVALVGASGAGKSSVVRAGLIPRLRKDTERPWEIVTIVPGDRPLHNLAAALMPLLEPQLGENDLMIEIGKQANAFLQGDLQIRDVIERILTKQPGTERFLLVVDQWEELYTLAQKSVKHEKPNEKTIPQADSVKRFIDGLLDACAAGKLQVVLTLRGDFMGKAIQYRRLSDGLADAQVNLSAMKPKELQQAIEQPARKLRTDFESGLVELLLTDVGDEPGNLPLLEFVLKRLWHDTQRGRQLRLKAYKDMGRLKGALQQEADTLYQQLPSDQERQRLRSLLLQLVTSNEANGYTRRRIYQEGLESFAPLIAQLTKARLLVSSRDEHSGRSTLEVAHEALINDWPKLKSWLKEDSDFLAWRKHFYSALDDYILRRDKDALLSGRNLKDAKHWYKRKEHDLNLQEIAFIRQSQRHAFLRNGKIGLALLLPIAALTGFFGWAAANNLKPKIAIDVLLAQYLHYVREPDMVTIVPNASCPDGISCQFMMGNDQGDNATQPPPLLPNLQPPPLPNDKLTISVRSQKPPHLVHFAARFQLGRYEVTFDEYQVFAYLINREGGCPVPRRDGVMELGPVVLNHNGWGMGQRPAIHVSWYDAQCYVNWLNRIRKSTNPYRLPTEAEWEYAMRAGSKTEYFWGDTPQLDETVAKQFVWFRNNSENKTHPVGQLKPNPFGLYDMVGNVSEWMEDCWHENYQNAPQNGKAWLEQNNGICFGHVKRGGSWFDFSLDSLRSAYRDHHLAVDTSFDIGFRLAQDLP